MLEAFALRVETLTPAERKVLQYYIEGYTIQEIASLLGETAAETKIALSKLKESISNE